MNNCIVGAAQPKKGAAAILLAIALAMLAGPSVPTPYGIARAAEAGDPPLPSGLDGAIAHGLEFLARQQLTDGSFERPRTTTTALSTLAFLSAGNVPELGKYGLAVRRAVESLLAQQAADGYFGAAEDHGMYAHAAATLALAEAYGVEPSPERRTRIHAALVKSIAVIVAAQNAPKAAPAFEGGWRFTRDSNDSDLSVTGWVVLALRAAQDAGIQATPDVRERALAFVLRCEDEKSQRGGSAGFAYQPRGPAHPAMTAIAIVCLYSLGAADAQAGRVDRADRYLLAHGIDADAPFAYDATWYLAQAALQEDGELWSKSGRSSLERLIKSQAKDGGWPAGKDHAREPGRAYTAALAIQALCVPYRLLPLYQR